MRVAVTGGAGFIGSNLAKELARTHEVIVLDNMLSGNKNNLEGFKGEIIDADIVDYDWEKLEQLDAIFHQAAITDTTISDEKQMMKVNFLSFKRLLEYCELNKIHLIYASSAATYGKSDPPMTEGKNERAANVYGKSKLKMDQFVREKINSARIPIAGLRYFNVYGPGEKYKGKMASMAWQLYTQIKEGKTPRLFKFGEQKRDFVYVKDVVKANILVWKSKVSGVFNAGSGKARSFNDMAAEIKRITGCKKKIEYFDNPYEFYQENTEADLQQIKEKTGYKPDFELEQGLQDYLQNVPDQ